MFVRVRVKGGPLHEFDVPVRDYESRKDRYVLVDGEPSKVSRPPTYRHAAVKKSRREDPAENTTTDAPAGA